jgi:hypothetical protein
MLSVGVRLGVHSGAELAVRGRSVQRGIRFV